MSTESSDAWFKIFRITLLISKFNLLHLRIVILNRTHNIKCFATAKNTPLKIESKRLAYNQSEIFVMINELGHAQVRTMSNAKFRISSLNIQQFYCIYFIESLVILIIHDTDKINSFDLDKAYLITNHGDFGAGSCCSMLHLPRLRRREGKANINCF